MDAVASTPPATETVQYRSLYEMLDRFPYILANDAEKHVECNEALYTALSEANDEWAMAETMQYADLLKRELTEPEKNITVSEFLSLETTTDAEKDEIYEAIANMDYPDIYQTFAVDERGAEILKDYGQITWYNEDMDMWFWGVTHYGTAWSHVMGNHMPHRNKDAYRKY